MARCGGPVLPWVAMATAHPRSDLGPKETTEMHRPCCFPLPCLALGSWQVSESFAKQAGDGNPDRSTRQWGTDAARTVRGGGVLCGQLRWGDWEPAGAGPRPRKERGAPGSQECAPAGPEGSSEEGRKRQLRGTGQTRSERPGVPGYEQR